MTRCCQSFSHVGVDVAAAHCGWRVLQAFETIEAMPVDPSRSLAWLGAIGPSAFEVGDDVLAAFYLAEDDLAVHPIPEADNKYFLDLNILAGRQLLVLGLHPSQISGGGTCTYSDPQRFYSYRRDGETGRMVTLILKNRAFSYLWGACTRDEKLSTKPCLLNERLKTPAGCFIGDGYANGQTDQSATAGAR